MGKYDEELDSYTLGDKGVKDIEHVGERPDGSSDGLYEAMDIDLGNGYKECSNWNLDLHKLGTLEGLFSEIQESTAEQLVEVFNQVKEELYPGKEKLTPREERKVYEIMNKYLKE